MMTAVCYCLGVCDDSRESEKRNTWMLHISTQCRFSKVFHSPSFLTESFGLRKHSSWVRGLRVRSDLEGYLIVQTRELSRYLFYVLPTYFGNPLDFSMGNIPPYSLLKCWMGLDPGATNGPSVWWTDFTLWPQGLGQGWAHNPNQASVAPSRTFVGTLQEEMSFLTVVTRLAGRL